MTAAYLRNSLCPLGSYSAVAGLLTFAMSVGRDRMYACVGMVKDQRTFDSHRFMGGMHWRTPPWIWKPYIKSLTDPMGMDRRKSPVQSKRMTFSSGKVVVICAIVTTLCSVGLSMTMVSGGISHVSVQKVSSFPSTTSIEKGAFLLTPSVNRQESSWCMVI